MSSAHLLISSSLHHFIASSPHLLMRRCEPVVPSPSIVIHPDSLPQRKWRRWIGRRAETESRMMQQERSFWKKGVLYKEVAFLSGCPLVVTLASSPLHPRFIPALCSLYTRSLSVDGDGSQKIAGSKMYGRLIFRPKKTTSQIMTFLKKIR